MGRTRASVALQKISRIHRSQIGDYGNKRPRYEFENETRIDPVVGGRFSDDADGDEPLCRRTPRLFLF